MQVKHKIQDQREPRWGPSRFAWLAIVTVTVLAYLPTVHTHFLADDYRLFTKPMGDSLSAILRTHEWYVRPVPALWMRGDFLLWGTSTIGSHLTNLLLHLATTVLMGLLVGRVTTNASIALCSAALFGLHPIHPGAVSWLSGRFDLCCAMFGLLAVLKFDDHLRSGSKRDLALSVLAVAAALLSKESAVAFIPALVLWCWLARTHRRPDSARPWKPLALFGLALLLYSGLRVVLVDHVLFAGRIDLTSGAWWQHAILTPLRHLALPLDTDLWAGWASPLDAALLGLLGVTAAWSGAAALRARQWPSRAAILGLGLLLLCIAPLAPVMHRLDAVVPPTRLLYAASIGFCIVLGNWIGRRRPAVRWPLLSAWLLLYGAGLFGNNLAWRRAGELAWEVTDQLAERIAERDEPYRRLLIQDPPRFHHGAYVYLGGDLSHAVNLALGKRTSTAISGARQAVRITDLRTHEGPWLGFQWDAESVRLIDITPRLRRALAECAAVEQETRTWSGEELRAWAPAEGATVSVEGLTIQALQQAILLEGPVLPVNTAGLEVRVSVHRLRGQRRPPRLTVSWTGSSRTTERPAMSLALKEGETILLQIPAPPVASVEDLEERNLRASLALPRSPFELRIQSIRLHTLQ